MRAFKEKVALPSGHSFRVLQWDRTISKVECLIGPNQKVPVTGEGTHWHFHVEMELTLFITGQGTRFVGDNIGTFTSGDLVLLGEKLPHYWHTLGDSSGISVQWHFPESHPFWKFPENLALAELFGLTNRGLRLTGQTASEITRLLRQLPSATGVGQLGLLLTALGHLATAPDHERRPLSTRSFTLPTESRYQTDISKAVRHLVANFRDEIRLEDVLKLTSMSRPTFARQFKLHAGRTFSDFLNHLRLEASCRELESSERGILDIALACGFSQISFFNRVFRRVKKCSPSAYRQKSKCPS